jgi:adenine deaminase
MAVAAGVPPHVAVAMGSTNPALYYGLASRHGSIAPGKVADAVVVRDLRDFDPTDVVVDGAVLVRDQRSVVTAATGRYPKNMKSSVRWSRALAVGDLRIATKGRTARVRVIEVCDGTLLSERSETTLPVVDGAVQADPARDVLKVAVVDRNSGRMRAGLAFVRGTGLQEGAVATTYCHVHQNMLLVGTSDVQMVLAAEAVRQMGGGVAVVGGRRVTARWELPLMGVFSTEPIDRTKEDLENVNAALRAIGCRFSSPVLSFAFIALTTIPRYGLTERGLYDVDRERFVPTVVSGGRG